MQRPIQLPPSDPSERDADGISRPTHVHWYVIGLLMAYTAVCHFNRVSMSVAGTERIMKQFSIDETSMGMVYSAYLLAYTICMVPGGWLIDRAGPWAALVIMGFGSAALVALTSLPGLIAMPALSVWISLMAVRAVVGIFTAPIHPAAARMASFWSPASSRALANGLITGAALIGIAGAPTIFGSLIDRFDWPQAFIVCGGATALLTTIWTLCVTSHPRDHAGVNAAELQLIAHDSNSSEPIASTEPLDGIVMEAPAEASPVDSATPEASSLLANRSLWMLTLSFAAVGYFEYLFFYWLEHYFIEVLKLSIKESRFYTMIPNLAMAVGMPLGGWLTDRVGRHYGSCRGRAIVPVAGMIVGAIAAAFGALTKDLSLAVSCFAVAMGAVGACEASFWLTAVELGGLRGGTGAAILNTGGNAGGLLAPVITPLFAKFFGWQRSIYLASIFCLLGAALWRWIDPRERSANPPSHSDG